MPDICAVSGCLSRRCAETKQRGITFHVFPKDGERRREWEVALRRKDFVVCDRTQICSQHFRDEDFDRTGQITRLKDGAVPTIFSSNAHFQRVSTGSRAWNLDLSLDDLELDDLVAIGQGRKGRKRDFADHTYGLPACPKAIKAKLVAATLRVRSLECEKIKTLRKEARTRKKIEALLMELKDKNLIDKELNDKLQQHPGFALWRARNKQAYDAYHASLLMDDASASEEQNHHDGGLSEVLPADVQQVFVIKEEVLDEEEDWSPGPDQEDQKPPQIKEEQEEAEITEFTFIPVHVKNEDDEEKPQRSELLQSESEGNGDSVEPESDEDKTSNCSSETDVSEGNWEESEARSGVDSVKNNGDPVSDGKCAKGKKLHFCPDCGKTYRRRQSLIVHRRHHTGKNLFCCSTCNKTFSSKRGLQEHAKVHTGERPFKCSTCGAALKSKNALIEHTRTHTGEKPYSCSLCGRSFGFRSSLTVHMRCHSEVKPYSCSICSLSFKRKNVLLAHIQTHTGDKPYRCSVCGKSFAHCGSLTYHMQNHTREKPYSCSVCGKSFAHCIGLTTHMRNHTGERPYSCSICKMAFKWRSLCTNHMKTHTDK